jgi:hypothetical protein
MEARSEASTKSDFATESHISYYIVIWAEDDPKNYIVIWAEDDPKKTAHVTNTKTFRAQ